MSWRTEAPAVASLALLGGLVRLPALIAADSLLDSDNALGPLMAREIAAPALSTRYLPLMLDGQDYIGALEAYLMAPLCSLAPGAPQALVGYEILLFCLVLVPLLYRLCHAIGGRAGAVAGTLLVAVGSPELIALTTAAPIGYLSNLAIGLLILFAGWRWLDRPSAWRLGQLGLLTGLGYWNNPQVAVFVGSVVLAMWSRGQLFGHRRAGALRVALKRPLGRVLALTLGAAVCATALILVLPVVAGEDGWKGTLLGVPVSLEKPQRYFPRGAVAIIAALAAIELYLAPSRWRWLVRAGTFAGASILGALPYIAYHATGQAVGKGSWMRWQLHTAPEFFHGFLGFATEVLVGADEQLLRPDLIQPAPTQALWLYPVLVLATVYILLRVVEAWTWRHRAELTGLLQLRASLSGPVLVALGPAATLTAISVMRGGVHDRYLLPLWIPLCVAVADVVRGLWPRRRRLVIAAFVVVIGHWLVGHVCMYSQRLPARHERAKQQVIDALRAAGVRHALGNYWVAYDLTYRADRDPIIGCDLDPSGSLERFRRFYEVSRRQRVLVRVFDMDRPEEHHKLSEVRRDFAGRIERELALGESHTARGRPRYRILWYRTTR